MELETTNWPALAQALLCNLQTQRYEVWVGTLAGAHISASSTDDSITYSHNLGGSGRPTQARALALLELMGEVHRRLVAADEAFRQFVAGKRFSAELIVFSGQMDFRVATLGADGAVTWLVDLG
jgi:hypothetical protein